MRSSAAAIAAAAFAAALAACLFTDVSRSIGLVVDGLSESGIEPPSLTVLTHSHWDHVFGAAEIGAPVIAHLGTAARVRRRAMD